MKPVTYKEYDKYYRLARNPFRLLTSKKLNFTGDPLPEVTSPMFVLCNHNTDFDFMILMGMSRNPLEFVATETMLRMGKIQNYLAKRFNLILHDKGSKGAATIKQIVTRIKDGRNVVLFPEGNRSFDGKSGEISPAIAKIVKMTEATLVVYKLEGGYLTTPRWGRKIRKGKMTGKLMSVISPEEVRKMPVKELQTLIEKDLFTDAYEEQKTGQVAFKSKVRAEYLETLLFSCPKCRKIGTLKSKKNILSCNCGYKAKLDEYGYLFENENKKLSITGAVEDQKKYLNEIVAGSGDKSIWSDNVYASKLTNEETIEKNIETTITAFKDAITIGSDRFTRESITSIDIVQRNRLIIHVKGCDHRYEFTGDITFNAFKYRLWHGISFA